MDRMEEKLLRLPTNIQVKLSDESIDHYIIDGTILKKSKICILLEVTTLWKKFSDRECTPTLIYNKPDGTKPYVVILFDTYQDPLTRCLEYDARFFDNLEDAQRYYSCFSSKETKENDYVDT
jgi:hypothetical protein